MRVIDLESIRIKLASPEDILSWSHGEVTKPETINYRTQKSEKDGLFCQKIFGPEKDYECYCGKYKRIRYKGMTCDKCGVEITKSLVRRERMGHIKLACPVSHIWFLKGVPSRMGMVLDIPMQQLERVIYFASYIVVKINDEARKEVLKGIENEYKIKSKTQQEKQKSDLKQARNKAREELLGLKPLMILSEVKYHELSSKYGEVFEAETGSEAIRKIFEKTDLKKISQDLKQEIQDVSSTIATETKRKKIRRLKFLEGLLRAGIRPEWMFLTILPILPPDLRPMVQLDGGRYASSDLNDLYRRVINRNNRLKYLIEINAPEVICRNEKRMLQEAVDALIDNGMRKGQTTMATTGGKRLLKSLSDMLKGKQGRFRQNLLGKRVDYSGRSVIVIGPELRHDQCGLPKKMALELFKPFVIHKVLEKELAYNVKGATRLIEEEKPEIWAILEDVVKNKLVLLNRAPTLHRLGIQAFQPVLMEGEAIRIPPLVCKAFNADFDGDQMPVHLPLSDAAQKEARERMLSTKNLLKPATGSPIVAPDKDIVLGCYWLTILESKAKGEGKIFASKEEALLAQDCGFCNIRAKIKIRNKAQLIETSIGRILFNEALPLGHSFVNKPMNGDEIEKVISDLIEKNPKELSQVIEVLDKIKKLGYEFSTLSGISWGMDDLIIPKEKKELIRKAEETVAMIDKHYKKGLLSMEEKASQVIATWQETKAKVEKLVPSALPRTGPVFTIVESKARGNWSQVVQMSGMKGLVVNPAGRLIEFPVKSSFKEGFDVLEYFISTHGARKGTTDTALRTSEAGYLTRRLVTIADDVIVNEDDCKDKTGLIVFKADAEEVGQNFLYKILGKVCMEDIKDIVKKGELIDFQKARAIIKAGLEKLQIRSPLSCKAVRGICRKCYGWDLGSNQLVNLGEAVGVVAAQAIGEPGTQLTMRTFHTGGVAAGGDITQGLPRVGEIFEARVPAGKALMSCVSGKVADITPERIIKIKAKSEKKKKEEIMEYKIPAKRTILVEKGQEIKKGQQLCEGHLDLAELFRLTDAETVKRYIVQEVQRIYVSHGVKIHDKHIELIAGKMFSRVEIKIAGDSVFSPGDIIEKTLFNEENVRLKKNNKKLAVCKPVLLGITKASLTTDGFLSAASFQETSRILIKSALEGKEDKLFGLKENVMIGKLIPAGTGFKK